MRQRVLLFMVGAERREVSYCLADAPVEQTREMATLAPVALVKLQKKLGLAEYPDQVIALVTAKAREREQEVRDAFVFDGVQIPVKFIDIPDGSDPAQLRDTIALLLTNIPDNCDLIIDVTHGFRSTPLVFSLAVQYLSLVNPSVTVREMYYGMVSNDNIGAIVNMSPYIDMLEWVYVMRVFRDTLLPARLIQKIRAAAGEEHADENASRLLVTLDLFSVATEAALPVEMARTAAALHAELERGIPEGLKARLPLGERLFGALKDVASEFIPQARDVPEVLDDLELERQAKVIEKLLNHGRVVQALGLMNEWCTLKVFLENNRRKRNNLLRWRERDQQENARELLTRGDWRNQELKESVLRVAKLRNELHHYAQQNVANVRLERVNNDAVELWNFIRTAKAGDWIIELQAPSSRSRPLTQTLGEVFQRAQTSTRARK